MTNFGKDFRKDFNFAPEYTPINHGSFGTYPAVVKPVLRDFQDQAEAHPDRWHRFEMKPILDRNLKRVADLIHCDSNDLAFVANASNGVNTVLRSFPFQAGDKVLCYQTAYVAVDKTLEFIRDQYKVQLVQVQLNYPLEDEEVIRLTKEAIEREHAKDEPKIRMCVVDALSSLPGVRLPFEAVTRLVQDHGILSLVDGAHAIGQIDLNISELDPDFFITNLHKWLYAPRGCAILYVAKRNQGYVHPTTINYAYKLHADSAETSTFSLEHALNTVDPSPFLCVGAAMDYRASIGGEEAIRKYTHDVAVKGGALVAEMLGTQVMENSTKTLTVSMVNVEVPAFKTSKSDAEVAAFFLNKSVYKYHTMFPIYKNNGKWWIRLCGQIYVDLDDFKKAGESILNIVKDIEAEN